MAGHTNNMIDGLRQRIRLLSALNLAKEAQQNPLPLEVPQVSGLGIAGESLYCDKVRGDYYDYFQLPGGNLGIVVAEASGHGVGAAMHMTTIRAFMHFGIRQYQESAQLIEDINRQAPVDSSQTSRFMSIFFLDLNPARKTLRWVRAGHEPALYYKPSTQAFSELNGQGIALGVDKNYRYDSFSRREWDLGDIIIVGTDGIHESRNPQGEMSGRIA